MAVRGVYTEAEKNMLARWKEDNDKAAGWLGEQPTNNMPYPVFHRVATKELILHMAYAADYWNPLWRDENYARNTRWGGIIAPPFFENCISHGGGVSYLEIPPEFIAKHELILGEFWEFFRPIRINDSFKVWFCSPKIEDITNSEENATRRFKITPKIIYINQRDEVVSTCSHYAYKTILPAGTEISQDKKKVSFTEEYVYTEDDIEAIDKACESEEIRGAKIRYWEDVEIGDKLKPVVMGPITSWDQVVELQGFGLALLPTREVRKQTPERIIVDPNTNIPQKSITAFHMGETGARILGSYSTTILGVTTEHFFGRLITNWMGDDGFLRKFDWKKFANTPIGDTIFGRGKVTKKYINENGENLVELDCLMETVRGYISNVVTATVRLPSKEKDINL